MLQQGGAFDGPASVRLDLRCGSMDVATEAGPGWALNADYAGPPPIVDATADRLDIQVPESDDVKRQAWTVRLAPDRMRDLDVSINAANGTVRLDGSTLARLDIDANASDLLVAGAAAAAVDRLDVSVNAGRIRITLGPGSTIGDLSLNAGESTCACRLMRGCASGRTTS